VNQDGAENVLEPIAIVKALFASESHRIAIDRCTDTADADDDGTVALADALYLLRYLYLGGPATPPPSGSCGGDPPLVERTTVEARTTPRPSGVATTAPRTPLPSTDAPHPMPSNQTAPPTLLAESLQRSIARSAPASPQTSERRRERPADVHFA
jgi:hypothetical protein